MCVCVKERDYGVCVCVTERERERDIVNLPRDMEIFVCDSVLVQGFGGQRCTLVNNTWSLIMCT